MTIPHYDPESGRQRQSREIPRSAPAPQPIHPRSYDPDQSGGTRGWILQQLLDFVNPLGYLAKKQRRNARGQQRQASQPSRRRWF